MFFSTLGTWNTTLLDLELKDDVKPVCSRPYPVPRVHKDIPKNKFKILVSLGVIKHSNFSKWVALYFYRPKGKTNCV